MGACKKGNAWGKLVNRHPSCQEMANILRNQRKGKGNCLSRIDPGLSHIVSIDIENVPSWDILYTIFHQVAGDLDGRVQGEKMRPGLIGRTYKLADGTVHDCSDEAGSLHSLLPSNE